VNAFYWGIVIMDNLMQWQWNLKLFFTRCIGTVIDSDTEVLKRAGVWKLYRYWGEETDVIFPTCSFPIGRPEAYHVHSENRGNRCIDMVIWNRSGLWSYYGVAVRFEGNGNPERNQSMDHDDKFLLNRER